MNLDASLTEDDVESLFQLILRRPVNNDQYKAERVSSGLTLSGMIAELRGSEELRLRMQEEYRAHLEAQSGGQSVEPRAFRAPQDLAVTPVAFSRVLIVGSCLSEAWADRLAAMDPPCPSDFYFVTNELPAAPPRPISTYDFQIVQPPLRSVLPDAAFARLSQTDLAGHQRLFDHAVDAMRSLLETGMRWNRESGILTFVFPFLVPQQNPLGRLMPRYDLRNPVYFIEKLNEALAAELQSYSNAYFFDLNEIIASHGRRHALEDGICAFNHGAFLGNFDFGLDRDRLEPVVPAMDLFDGRFTFLISAAWLELVATYRTIRQIDMVKMVVVDLDDTLWRGVIADLGLDQMPTSEGWPKGFWEALLFLKRRGIILAIISKNEESRVLEAWDHILHGQITLDDFAMRRINWRPKAENMAEILAHVNLLPGNVVYIDDNPAQRAEIKAAFPAIRVLGGNPVTWRRLLLWSAETQTPAITDESAARTEMVRAQVAREETRQSLSREEFLASLKVQVTLFAVDSVANPRFPRVLELINKTNQFNTTGKRWTQEECALALSSGEAEFYAFDVTDVYTAYGLVGVLVVDEEGIRQFVMSCRVMGLQAEIAAVAAVAGRLRARGLLTISCAMVETEKNLPCRDLYARCGFQAAEGGRWVRDMALPLPVPAHVTLVLRTQAETMALS
jgi:FkbH-like protein